MNKAKRYIDQAVIDRIAEVCRDSELSIPEFGKSIGLSKSRIYDLLTGVGMPGTSTVLAICKKYNVSADWLLGLR